MGKVRSDWSGMCPRQEFQRGSSATPPRRAPRLRATWRQAVSWCGRLSMFKSSPKQTIAAEDYVTIHSLSMLLFYAKISGCHSPNVRHGEVMSMSRAMNRISSDALCYWYCSCGRRGLLLHEAAKPTSQVRHVSIAWQLSYSTALARNIFRVGRHQH